MTTLDTYRTQAERLGPDAFLGRLFWYSLSNVRLPHDEMIRMLHQCGITRALPRVPEDHDVFQRVAAACKRDKIPTLNPEEFDNFIMRRFFDKETLTRRIIRETVNNAGKRIGFHEEVDVVFHHADSRITVHQRDRTAALSPVVARMVTEIETEFAHWRNCLNLYGVRTWVRDRLIDMNATMVKTGLYFLAQDHVAVVEQLECFGALINDGGYGEVVFHALPLVDDDKQRSMVRRAFEAESAEAIEAQLGEIAKLVEEGKEITLDRYTRLVTEYQQIAGRTQEYETVLEDTLANTATGLKLLQQSLVSLRAHVRASDG